LRITAVTFVIGEVLAIGVVFGNPVAARRLVDVPADEIDGVAEIGAIGPILAGRLPVPVPGAVQRLAVAVSRRPGWTRKNPEDPGPQRALAVRAPSYQSSYSAKMAQALLMFCGGAVVQATSSSRPHRHNATPRSHLLSMGNGSRSTN
jgi:hypothetical protein